MSRRSDDRLVHQLRRCEQPAGVVLSHTFAELAGVIVLRIVGRHGSPGDIEAIAARVIEVVTYKLSVMEQDDIDRVPLKDLIEEEAVSRAIKFRRALNVSM